MSAPDIRDRLGLKRVINVAGNMTSLGASIARPEAIAAAAEMLPHFVSIDDLQRRASTAIAQATGAEAGCVTACASAGMSIAIAATMTGADLAAIEALPTTGPRKRVVVQLGHMCHYSAPLEQSIRLTGAEIATFGNVNRATAWQLAHVLDETVTAMMFVVSHQTVQHGQVPLAECIRVCHAAGVPVIVDAAAETDLTGFIAAGADLVVYSAHKGLGSMTGGIVAGRKDLVRAAYLQSRGIGRGMKVGKEGIAAAIAALEAWPSRDHAGEQAEQERVLDLWREALRDLPDARVETVDDPTGNPIRRLAVRFLSANPAAAAAFADRLGDGDPAIVVRDEFIDINRFDLDPCNLHPGEAEDVAERLRSEAAKPGSTGGPAGGMSVAERQSAATARLLAWPD